MSLLPVLLRVASVAELGTGAITRAILLAPIAVFPTAVAMTRVGLAQKADTVNAAIAALLLLAAGGMAIHSFKTAAILAAGDITDAATAAILPPSAVVDPTTVAQRPQEPAGCRLSC